MAYKNKKNSAFPRKKASPLKNPQFFNHIGVSHKNWDHADDGGWKPTEENMEWLDEYYGTDESGSPDEFLEDGTENPDYNPNYGESLNPWRDDGDPTEVEVPDELLPEEQGGTHDIEKDPDDEGKGDTVAEGVDDLDLDEGNGEENDDGTFTITFNVLGQQVINATNEDNPPDLAAGNYFEVTYDADGNILGTQPYLSIDGNRVNWNRTDAEGVGSVRRFGGIGGGGELIDPSLDPNAKSVLQRQAEHRNETGQDRWSRGGFQGYGNLPWEEGYDDGTEGVEGRPDQDDNVSYLWESPNWGEDENVGPSGRPLDNDNVSYFWESPNYGQDDTGGPSIERPTFWEANQADRPKPTSPPNTSPIGGGGDTDIRPNTSSANTRPNTSPSNTSPANTRPGPPETSPANTRPTINPLYGDASMTRATDIFGNTVSPIDNRGRNVPFTTVSTPQKMNLNKNNKKASTKGYKMRGFNAGNIGKGAKLI